MSEEYGRGGGGVGRRGGIDAVRIKEGGGEKEGGGTEEEKGKTGGMCRRGGGSLSGSWSLEEWMGGVGSRNL